jgi:hemerythrin
MLIDWSDEYSIGIDKIDEQHKRFFATMHRFHEQCLTSEGEDVALETLAAMNKYATEHFEAEELLMREHEYPRLEEHLQLHAEFLAKYSELTEQVNDLGPSQDLAEQMVDMVQAWLVEHIAEADVQYAAHVKTRLRPCSQ